MGNSCWSVRIVSKLHNLKVVSIMHFFKTQSIQKELIKVMKTK